MTSEAGYGGVVSSSERGRVAAMVAVGLLWAVVLAWILSFIETRWEVSLFGLYVWFIIPVGALGCGAAAAAGYYAMCRLLDIKPGVGTGVALPLVIALVVYAMTNYFNYRYLAPSGLSFLDFYRDVLVNARYALTSSSDGSTVGAFGYGLAALEVLGAAGGSWLAANSLSDRHYCEGCGRYLDRDGIESVWIDEPATNDWACRGVSQALDAGDEAGARSVMAQVPEPKRRHRHFQLSLADWSCPSCHRRWLQAVGKRRKGNNWAVEWSTMVPVHQPRGDVPPFPMRTS